MKGRAPRARAGRSFALLAALVVAAMQLADTDVARGASFAVDTTVDAVDASPGDGVCETMEGACSLRAAIQEANALPGQDRIVLASGQYALVIPPSFPETDAAGDLDVTDNVEVVGEGASDTVIDGGNMAGVFEVDGSDVFLSGMTIQSGGHHLAIGGGVNNRGNLTLKDVTVRNNEGGNGGGIANFGSLDATDSVFIDNGASGSQSAGGAISNTGVMNLQSVSFLDNFAFIGGAIFNAGSATVVDSMIRSNGSPSRGGAIYNAHQMILEDSEVVANSAGIGAGLANDLTGELTIVNSRFDGNEAVAEGGGIFNENNAELHGLIVSNNTAAVGAGISNRGGILFVTNSTISAGDTGGALANASRGIVCVPPDEPSYDCPVPAQATLSNVTVNGNRAGAGSGIFNEAESTVSLGNTIVTGDSDSANCSGQTASSGHNLDDDGSCGLSVRGDLPNTDPLLEPLADNGGPTQTYALLTGSPAIDAADNGSCPATDQRGVARPQDGDGDGLAVCDIGAYELEGAPPAPTPSPSPVETSAPGATPEATLPLRLPATGGRPGSGFE